MTESTGGELPLYSSTVSHRLNNTAVEIQTVEMLLEFLQRRPKYISLRALKECSLEEHDDADVYTAPPSTRST
jgi:phage host-nuclease inhibitor protein Gam